MPHSKAWKLTPVYMHRCQGASTIIRRCFVSVRQRWGKGTEATRITREGLGNDVTTLVPLAKFFLNDIHPDPAKTAPFNQPHWSTHHLLVPVRSSSLGTLRDTATLLAQWVHVFFTRHNDHMSSPNILTFSTMASIVISHLPEMCGGVWTISMISQNPSSTATTIEVLIFSQLIHLPSSPLWLRFIVTIPHSQHFTTRIFNWFPKVSFGKSWKHPAFQIDSLIPTSLMMVNKSV
jgi:hypothetical protein